MPEQTTLEQRSPEQQSAVTISTGGAAQQNTLRNVNLISRYEFKKRVSQHSFIISTIVMLALIVIAAFVPTVALTSRGAFTASASWCMGRGQGWDNWSGWFE